MERLTGSGAAADSLMALLNLTMRIAVYFWTMQKTCFVNKQKKGCQLFFFFATNNPVYSSACQCNPSLFIRVTRSLMRIIKFM